MLFITILYLHTIISMIIFLLHQISQNTCIKKLVHTIMILHFNNQKYILGNSQHLLKFITTGSCLHITGITPTHVVLVPVRLPGPCVACGC